MEFEGMVPALLRDLGLDPATLRPWDCQAARPETDLQRLRSLVGSIQGSWLQSENDVPLLLSVGILAAVGHDFDKALVCFDKVAISASDVPTQALARHNTFLVRLEKKQWDEALWALQWALTLVKERFTPFPLDRYKPEGILRAGNFGVTFLCRDLQSGNLVVVKALHGHTPGNARLDIWTEIRALSGLEHPGIVRLLDHGILRPEAQFKVYLVLEYCDGLSLADYVARHGPLSPDNVLSLARLMAEALGAVHARGIVHRDVSPSNVMVRCDSAGLHVKLIDFGVARTPGTEASIRGQYVGTPGYAAPEQFEPGSHVGPQADVYGLARTICFLLFKSPQPGPNDWNKMPGWFIDLVAKCFREKPESRPGDGRQFLALLAPQASAPLQAPGPSTAVVEPSKASAIPGLSMQQEPLGPGDNRPTPLPISKASGTPGTAIGAASPGIDVPTTIHPGQMKPPSPPKPVKGPTCPPPIPPPQGTATPRRVATMVPESGKDQVDCTVFAPPSALAGDTILVQVFAHLLEQAESAARLAQEFDEQARSRGFKSLEVDIERGTILTIQLMMPGLQIDNPVQALKWGGRPASVQFGVTVPKDQKHGNVVGTVVISQDQVPIGHVKFKLEVMAGEPNGLHPQPLGPRGDKSMRYRNVFISYASRDRNEVLKRVQMLRRLKIECFQDILDLEPGMRWEKELYRRIDDSDLFLLFWSTAAKESEWVMREVRYALDRKGGNDETPPEIMPVILEGPPVPLPPPELQHLHFNDQTLHFATAHRFFHRLGQLPRRALSGLSAWIFPSSTNTK